MSVLDLLPHCVSGVYFIYHPDFEKFSLGKISALRETCLALEAGYKYYYMGYYIHSCLKMRYKNDYKPQYLLDLETMKWDPLNDDVQKLLDENHYVSVSLAREAVARAKRGQEDENAEKCDTLDKSKRQVFDSAMAAYEAVEDGLSLFDVEFPGMMTAEELEDTVDLDQIIVRLKPDVIVPAEVTTSPEARKYCNLLIWARPLSNGRSGPFTTVERT